MCKKPFALSLSLFLPLCFLSAQGLSPDDSAILENQKVILSILPALTESLNSREADLSKRDVISKAKEQTLIEREKSIIARESELSQTDNQLQKLKDDVKTVSESLSKEREIGKWKTRGIITMAVVAIGSILYGILK